MAPHGKSDWGLQLKTTVYTLDELSELAVRLGSIDFFDRRGDVLFLDDFSSGLSKWYAVGSGTGNKQLVTPEIARSGGYSIKLIGGKTTPWYSFMRTCFPYPVLSRIGYELHFCYTHLFDKLIFELKQDDADYSYEGAIQFDRTNNKLQYKDLNGDYQDIVTSFRLLDRANLFHVFKLVCNPETHKYHRLILNDTTYDLSAHDLYKHGSQGQKFYEVTILLYSRDGYNDFCYIDNIIVTQNEP